VWLAVTVAPVPHVLGIATLVELQEVVVVTISFVVQCGFVEHAAMAHAERFVFVKVIKNLCDLWLGAKILLKPFRISHLIFSCLDGVVKGFFGLTWIAIENLATILVVFADTDAYMPARIT
jgi:hypothetical protein